MDGMNVVGDLFGSADEDVSPPGRQERTRDEEGRGLSRALHGRKPRRLRVTPNADPPVAIVLATVKGDVHDIGKNIVGVVLQCNGYEVVDLGVMVPADRILEAARAEQVDVIGLSGLITPSLDQMVHVAREMERTGFTTPLLVGGATTSKAHTAVKIEGEYHGATVHVLDASRAVGVVGTLLDDNRRDAYLGDLATEYEEVRQRRAQRRERRALLSLDDARARRFDAGWDAYEPPAPSLVGTRDLGPVPVGELRGYIDWTPFFQAWELHGKYPAILEDATVGAQATALYSDAIAMLDRIEAERLLEPRAPRCATIGYPRENSHGYEVVRWTVFGNLERTLFEYVAAL